MRERSHGASGIVFCYVARSVSVDILPASLLDLEDSSQTLAGCAGDLRHLVSGLHARVAFVVDFLC